MYQKQIVDYDFAIDIDSQRKDGIITDAIGCAKEVKKIYDQYQLPYSLRFSGSKGFHFVILGKFIPIKNITKRIKSINSVTQTIKETISKEYKDCVDDSIADDRRVLKMPYTLDNWNMVLPLTDDQFERFHPDNMKLDYIMNNITLKDRNLITRNLSFTEKNIKNNIKKFFKEFNG